MGYQEMENLDIQVTDKAISIDGIQVCWALQIHKDNYYWECLENMALERDVNADAFASDDAAEYNSNDDIQPLDNGDDVAWK
jgi:hypothetical protein